MLKLPNTRHKYLSFHTINYLDCKTIRYRLPHFKTIQYKAKMVRCFAFANDIVDHCKLKSFFRFSYYIVTPLITLFFSSKKSPKLESCENWSMTYKWVTTRCLGNCALAYVNLKDGVYCHTSRQGPPMG